MTIDEAIETLKAAKEDGVKNIVLAYWEASAFGLKDDNKWAEKVHTVEKKMDWSDTHDDISIYVNSDVL